MGQLDKGGGEGKEGRERPLPFLLLATCFTERGFFQGPARTSGLLLTVCLFFREQRDRALGHRRKGSKAKRLLQVPLTAVPSPASRSFVLSLVV